MLLDYLQNQLSLSVFILFLLAIIISLSLHEFAHAFIANLLGDDTPVNQGRLTVNPFSHIDPLGLIFIIIAGFGWGKPVEINFFNFKRRYVDSALVSIAGPLMNFILVLISILIFHIAFNWLSMLGIEFLEIMIYLNISLGIFNLIPIPPLDGSKILMLFLPVKYRLKVETFSNNFSLLLLLIIIIPLPFLGGNSLISFLIYPITNGVAGLI